jgi:hypothetical protein
VFVKGTIDQHNQQIHKQYLNVHYKQIYNAEDFLSRYSTDVQQMFYR